MDIHALPQPICKLQVLPPLISCVSVFDTDFVSDICFGYWRRNGRSDKSDDSLGSNHVAASDSKDDAVFAARSSFQHSISHWASLKRQQYCLRSWPIKFACKCPYAYTNTWITKFIVWVDTTAEENQFLAKNTDEISAYIYATCYISLLSTVTLNLVAM